MKYTVMSKDEDGTQHLKIELGPEESLKCLPAQGYVRLGTQHGDIIPVSTILEAKEVEWCHVTQEWKDV